MSTSIYYHPLSTHQLVTFQLNMFMMFFFDYCWQYLSHSAMPHDIHKFSFSRLIHWLDVHTVEFLEGNQSRWICSFQFCFDYFINFSMERFGVFMIFYFAFLLSFAYEGWLSLHRKMVACSKMCSPKSYVENQKQKKKSFFFCTKRA